MELDLLGAAVQVVAEEEEGPAGWEAQALGPVPVGIVSALIAEPDYHIR